MFNKIPSVTSKSKLLYANGYMTETDDVKIILVQQYLYDSEALSVMYVISLVTIKITKKRP